MAVCTNSPLRRRSFKKVVTQVEENELLPENDDEAERLERRRVSGTFETLKDKHVVLGGIADFSASELVAHYASCIKLSAENKINHKNAFNLQLIDYMTSMLKKSDSKMNNFQVASCTLDASTKIYASRVDRVYMDVYKMASGLGVLPGRKRRSLDEDDDNDGGGERGGDEDGMAIKKKRKLKRGPKRWIAKSEESLNINTDSDYRLDPMFLYMNNKFGDSQPGSINFMSKMNVQEDNCELIMFPTEPYWQKQQESLYFSNAMVPTLPDLSGMTVCSAFKGLFLNENDDSMDCMPQFENSPEPDLEMDLNLEPEAEDNFEVTGIDEVAPEEESPIQTPAEQKPFNITEIRKHLAMKNQEYSYFNLDRASLWAGPNHWRIPPYKGEKQSTNTRTKKKEKEKKQTELNFMDTEDIPSSFVKGKSLTFSRQNLEKTWSAAKITNPIDEHYDPNNLTRLFLRKCVKHFGFWPKKEDILEEEEKEIPEYDYSNLNDSQSYCPAAVVDGDLDPPEEGDCDETLKPADDAQTTIGWKLVSPPPKIERIVIPYAQHEKRLDMKKLKCTIWEMLIKGEPNKENMTPSNEQERVVPCATEHGMLFSEMQQQLIARIPKTMAQDLSMHIAFTALLHLANEKNLALKGNGSFTDLEILQD